MNILVCVKQVPDAEEITMDEKTHTLIRAGVPSIVNPFDTYALTVAMLLKKENPDSKIILASMGPLQAEKALRTCLATVGEKAYLISDRHFGGSDSLATSYILSCAIKTIEEKEGSFDVILCGKQAIDGDTAQVGPELAEHLSLAQATGVVEASKEGNLLHIRKETERGYEIINISMPCLLTISKLDIEPTIPSLKAKLASRKLSIENLKVEDLNSLNHNRIGLKGSPTQVVKVHSVERKSNGLFLDSGDTNFDVAELVRLLEKKNLL